MAAALEKKMLLSDVGRVCRYVHSFIPDCAGRTDVRTDLLTQYRALRRLQLKARLYGFLELNNIL